MCGTLVNRLQGLQSAYKASYPSSKSSSWEMFNIYIRTFYSLLAVLALASSPGLSLTPDGQALLAFKYNLNDTGGMLSSWNETDVDPCQWTGVECDDVTRRVKFLNLPYRRLSGTIAPEIAKLDKLRRLALHSNFFYGIIPPQLGSCLELKALYLRNNFLSGPIPSELGRLSNLVILDISVNSLTGSVPASLGNLTKLVFLNVSTNSLVGEIPSNGVLQNFTRSSFAKNAGLCGPQINLSCPGQLFPPVSGPIPVPCTGGSKEASKNSNDLLMSALGTVGISLFVALMCFWGFFLYNKFGSKQCLAQVISESTRLVLFHGDLPYTSKEILRKIDQLDNTDIVGSGGFGTVYRLVMDDGNIFAVKKIGKGGVGSERLFERELEILGTIKHRNLVNLRGYCNAPSARLLIYDYLSKGSLDELVHDLEPHEASLSWAARLKIAIGAARGLAYLHHDCCPRIIHRDIKSSNILLDNNLEPHVSDFGLAKLLEEDESHVTTIVAGTFGYLAPEYMQSGRATEKGDVYSYGVVLLELISGKRPTDPSFVAKGLNVVGWVSTLMSENRTKEIFDPKCESGQKECMEAVLQIAASCIRPNAEERPTMDKVVKLLEAEIMSPCPTDFYESNSD
ncbi:hypothetical protein O6H91_02G134200 [Diphasiastrum complanatum]|uniref:Uncharacterized protein n=3 Tax=Diphasiastrum complanatum TaxID=34168 RepID=A0ACC2EHP5_DIPCM|nr:hypothetical protein O6H91_02G087300 [Diphasiastrum complanatum]KAJ7566083.1 hypothetical protein O6H91_02G087300 [Diphasiastrum complanatum]KAJ7567157.1 hypothetical protein O6H91_02G134200 [Diphasiastrum complanatum]